MAAFYIPHARKLGFWFTPCVCLCPQYDYLNQSDSPLMLFMIIERFRDGNAVPVYERFREKGRLAPDGLKYINSWVSTDLKTCYQVMECAEEQQLNKWIAAWDDLVDFEIIPVITSPEAAKRILP